MPPRPGLRPGPAFNWIAVAASVADILSHAARIKSSQLAATGAGVGVKTRLIPSEVSKKRRKVEDDEEVETKIGVGGVRGNRKTERNDIAKDGIVDGHDAVQRIEDARHKVSAVFVEDSTPPSLQKISPEPVVLTPQIPISTPAPEYAELIIPKFTKLESALTANSLPSEDPTTATTDVFMPARRSVTLESSKVPSSRIGRLFHYGGLAASLGYGAAAELVRRSATANGNQSESGSLMLTEGNVKRLVGKLTKMRGAALKLGQFMSIQDSHVLPPEIEDIFRRVQDSAHYMPDWQMEEVMSASLGPNWLSNFDQFDRIPFAAASIGQVHSAVLNASVSPTGRDERVAVKIQFPNIVDSIQSDLGYVKMLLTAGRLLPKGLFLDRTIEVMKAELADECNYTREASFLRRFGEPSHLGTDSRFKVPWAWEGSTNRVLVMEHVDGVSVGGAMIDQLTQQDRDDIAARIIELCLKELFVFREMQTDPNWTNFLWNHQTRQIELVDFGATRAYSKEFTDNWFRLLQAASSDDREACIEWSLKVGYLTGAENELMRDAHVKSMTLLATPFKEHTSQPFAFGPGSEWSQVTAEIREQIPVMLRHRLTPPPRETYSLNRKLSGAFLLAARLNARVDCRHL